MERGAEKATSQRAAGREVGGRKEGICGAEHREGEDPSLAHPFTVNKAWSQEVPKSCTSPISRLGD